MALGPVKKRAGSWLKIFILLLSIEKSIQHTFVTLAFAFNWQGIRESVVFNPTLLMILGGIEVVLFLICVWGVSRNLPWSLNVLVGLSLLDIFGEMYAQGKVIIAINVSFVVAITLLVLVLLYKRAQSKNTLVKQAPTL